VRARANVRKIHARRRPVRSDGAVATQAQLLCTPRVRSMKKRHVRKEDRERYLQAKRKRCASERVREALEREDEKIYAEERASMAICEIREDADRQPSNRRNSMLWSTLYVVAARRFVVVVVVTSLKRASTWRLIARHQRRSHVWAVARRCCQNIVCCCHYNISCLEGEAVQTSQAEGHASAEIGAFIVATPYAEVKFVR